MCENWSLHICGSRGSIPAHGEEFKEFGGATSCYVLKKGRYALVVDCGSGLCSAAGLLENCEKIDVLLTHLHYDHLIGILGYSVFPAKARVNLYGTFDKWFGERTLGEFFRKPFWPVVPRIGPCISLKSPGSLELEKGLRIMLFFFSYPDNANIVRIDAEGFVLSMLFDYEHIEEPPDAFLEGCALLLYDGMYTEEEYVAHRDWGHSCWQEGCRLAEKYEIPLLAIVHHEPRRTDRELLEMEREAKKRFPKIHFARMGDQMTLCRQETWR